MIELLATFGQARLGAPMGASDMTVTVQAGHTLPTATGQFRLTIPAPFGTPSEILLLASPPAGLVYTVLGRAAEGPAVAAAYASGSPCVAVLTAGAIANLLAAVPLTPTAHTIPQGQAYTQLATDTVILFDTSAAGQATATLDMIAGSYIGQTITLKWFGWGNLQTKPTVVAEPGTNLVDPYSGMSASGVGGLVASTTLSTPGGSWTLKWSGTYWLTA